MGDLIGIASVLAKWGLYIGVLGGAGTVFCAVLFRFEARRTLIAGLAGIGVLSAAISFALKGSALTGSISGMADPEMLGLLWETQSGTALRWQIGGLVLMLVGLLMFRLGGLAQILGAVVAVYGLAVIGHVYDRGDSTLFWGLFLHLICVALWVGILVPLHRRASGPDGAEDAAELGERFGRVAMTFVPLLLIAGGSMAYGLIESRMLLLNTDYGQVLLLKVALVTVLLSLATLNKLIFVPGLRVNNSDVARSLVRMIMAEGVMIALILLATAILTTALTLPNLH